MNGNLNTADVNEDDGGKVKGFSMVRCLKPKSPETLKKPADTPKTHPDREPHLPDNGNNGADQKEKKEGSQEPIPKKK